MTETTETEIMSASGCPVSHTDYTIQRPLLETYELLNAERERGPFLWNDSRPRPFWMITDYEHVLEALQMPPRAPSSSAASSSAITCRSAPDRTAAWACT